MLKPSMPINESARVAALKALRILDTAGEERFDRITRMARRVFAVDICLISLVDSQRQWFKSNQGLDVTETSRDISFCGHAILDHEVFVVPDARLDSRFADNPLVTDEPHIRFYAGCPIHDPGGHRIGTICVLHSQPRKMSQTDKETLYDLAAMVECEVKISSQVTVDEVTQIANRRGFYRVANHILSLCRRTGTNAELAFFDLDGFRSINETYGHAAGDELLHYFAGMLTQCFRKADAIGRLGGDEFVALLGGSSNSAAPALERLRKMAADADSEIQQKLAWSVGTIQFDPERHSTIESLLCDADSIMYDDKVRRRFAGAI